MYGTIYKKTSSTSQDDQSRLSAANNNSSNININNNNNNNNTSSDNNNDLNNLNNPSTGQLGGGAGGSDNSGDHSSNSIVNQRKKIYSHCHVQDEENKQASGGVDKSARRRLIAASIICLVFMIGEVVGGILSNSLAIAADAAHLLTDFASFMISLFALWLGSRPASRRMSFGWYRAEVIGALISVLLIWIVTGLLVYLAVERLRTSQYEIDSEVMVITAAAGLLVNIIMALALNVDGHSHGFHSHGHGHHHNHNHDEGCETDHIDASSHLPPTSIALHDSNSLPPIVDGGSNIIISQTSDKNYPLDGLLSSSSASQISNNKSSSSSPASKNQSDHHTKSNNKHEDRGRGRSNINVRAAFIHVIGDFLQSLGVLITALVIHFVPEYSVIDPICTFIFSIIVLITTLNIIRDATNVLMEGIPNGINFIEVREKLQELPSVIRVHNLRIWSLSLDKIACSTHLVINDSKTPSEALKMAIDTLKSTYNFFEVTIQVEEYKEDMRDCEHCQKEEVVISVDNNNS